MSAATATTALPPTGWLVSRSWDLAVFGGSALLAVALRPPVMLVGSREHHDLAVPLQLRMGDDAMLVSVSLPRSFSETERC